MALVSHPPPLQVDRKLRVLFVDDEAPVLDGLRNRLRRQRSKWNLSFALGGPAAVEMLASQTFDVVVTDMRMPVIDGAELLRRVHRDHPHAIRIVLSGHADLESVLRVVPIAHRYLSKPCKPEELESSIERASQLALCVQGENVCKLAGNVRALPPVPLLYMQLSSALESDKTGTNEIASLVGRDMAMTAKVLQIANSSFFGAQQKIVTIERAIAYLGVGTIQTLVLGAEVFRPNPGHPAQLQASLDEAHTMGIKVGRLAAKFFSDRNESQAAFLAGMMHDVGDLVLLTAFAAEYDQFALKGLSDPRPREIRESEQFGASHAEVGAHLLGLWGLPQTTGEAAGYHHRPRELRHDRFEAVDAVHVAHELLHAAIRGNVQEHAVDVELLASFGVADELPRWCSLAEDVIRRTSMTGVR
jgi:HD-like signal output (HDOD) protein